jgi:hypothetical protein
MEMIVGRRHVATSTLSDAYVSILYASDFSKFKYKAQGRNQCEITTDVSIRKNKAMELWCASHLPTNPSCL